MGHIKTRAIPKRDYAQLNLGAGYPAEARARGIQGDIRVQLIVDSTGKVRSPVLLNGLGYGLDELALTQAAQLEFEPAKDLDDRPLTTVVVWTFHMTLLR